MRKSKSLMSLILALLLLLVPMLYACTDTDGAADSGDAKESGAVSESESSSENKSDSTAEDEYIFLDKKMKYRIVYASSGSTDVQSAANDLYNMLTGYVSDKNFVVSDTAVANSADECEILVGLTNRPESAEAAKGLKEYTYIIKKINNKIVILADKDWIVSEAMDVFKSKIKV